MGHFRFLRLLLSGILTINLLSGCSTAGSEPAASYTGKTTPAVVSSDNGKELSKTALDGASPSNSNASVTGDVAAEDKEQLRGLSRGVHSSVGRLDLSKALDSQRAAALYSFEDRIDSECGGYFTYTSTYDSVSHSYSASMKYSDYTDCTEGSVFDGDMTVSGTMTLVDGSYYLSSFKATFNALTFTEGSESIMMTGQFDITEVSSTHIISTMNMDFRDESSKKTIKLVDYVVDEKTDKALSPTYTDYDMSGTVYNQDHGSIVISTITVARVVEPDEYPSSGQMQIVGAASSKALVTFTSNNTYSLQIDSDGDSTYETSLSCTWNPNECN